MMPTSSIPFGILFGICAIADQNRQVFGGEYIPHRE
jgi:hypothetical protein